MSALRFDAVAFEDCTDDRKHTVCVLFGQVVQLNAPIQNSPMAWEMGRSRASHSAPISARNSR